MAPSSEAVVGGFGITPSLGTVGGLGSESEVNRSEGTGEPSSE